MYVVVWQRQLNTYYQPAPTIPRVTRRDFHPCSIRGCMRQSRPQGPLRGRKGGYGVGGRFRVIRAFRGPWLGRLIRSPLFASLRLRAFALDVSLSLRRGALRCLTQRRQVAKSQRRPTDMGAAVVE